MVHAGIRSRARIFIFSSLLQTKELRSSTIRASISVSAVKMAARQQQSHQQLRNQLISLIQHQQRSSAGTPHASLPPLSRNLCSCSQRHHTLAAAPTPLPASTLRRPSATASISISRAAHLRHPASATQLPAGLAAHAAIAPSAAHIAGEQPRQHHHRQQQ